jgi:hypothetical protein
MTAQSLIDSAKFWKIVTYLIEMEEKFELENLTYKLEVSESELKSYVNFLRNLNYHIEFQMEEGHLYLVPPANKPLIKFEFNLLDWIKFQAHFPVLSKLESKPYHHSIKEKLSEVETSFKEHDLFESLNLLDEVAGAFKEQSGNVISLKDNINYILEEATLLNKCLKVSLSNSSTIAFYPRKMVHIDGHLSLVGEGMHDKCLNHIEVSSICDAEITDSIWSPIYSLLEIDDFIASIRAISENEVRLILKVYAKDQVEINLKQDF